MSESPTTATEPGPEAEKVPEDAQNDSGGALTEAAETEAGDPKTVKRRLLRAVGRWTAAVTVFGVLGAGIALGLTQPERTDLPGLATEHDGRWDYPEVSLPALPSGAPLPYAPGNGHHIHHVNIRDLLLPAPEGARKAEELPPMEGAWVSPEEFAQVYAKKHRDAVAERLEDDAVRHIAARGWVMPDGTRTSIYLVQHNSEAFTEDFFRDFVDDRELKTSTALAGAPHTTRDESWPRAIVSNVVRHAYDEKKPRGERHVRQAYLEAGDTLALVIQSRPGRTPDVPFQQTVILQSQLLG